MQLSHPDYIILVLETYKKQQRENKLSPLLANLTRANIRRECRNVYTERTRMGEKEEASTLRAFFGVPPAGKNFGSLIEDCHLDKFRPLETLMKKRIKNPDMANVELLAWLIDFRLRPHVFKMEVTLNEDELAILGNPRTRIIKDVEGPLRNEPGKDEQPNEGDSNPLAPSTPADISKKNKLKLAIIIFLIAATAIGGIYIIGQREGFNPMGVRNANTGCMYWAGDHYEEMPCSEERKDRLKLPMDSGKMTGFKKIMREDTITRKSIGKVYYIKINGAIEYYTTDGNHPVDVTRTLHPLSVHIFETYLNK